MLTYPGPFLETAEECFADVAELSFAHVASVFDSSPLPAWLEGITRENPPAPDMPADV